MFAGAHTAIVTPFQNGSFDEETFRKLVELQIDGGISGIVPVGTTGESPTLSHTEHHRVIELTVEAVNKRALVIAGTGSNATAEAIDLTQAAEKAGADASLQVAPYYNKPSQEGLFRHFKAIAESTNLPIVLYSIPGRCGIEISLETTARLHQACPNIIAMKEAGGTVERVSALRDLLPDTFQILSGDDSLTLPFMSVGASGVISVASNLIPKVMSDLVRAGNAGNWAEAQRLHASYYPLFSAFLKLDTNPVPIKAAMHLAGLIADEIRLPMVALDDAKRPQLQALLQRLELLA